MESQPYELVAMIADTGTSAPPGQLPRATAYRRTIDNRAWLRRTALVNTIGLRVLGSGGTAGGRVRLREQPIVAERGRADGPRPSCWRPSKACSHASERARV